MPLKWQYFLEFSFKKADFEYFIQFYSDFLEGNGRHLAQCGLSRRNVDSVGAFLSTAGVVLKLNVSKVTLLRVTGRRQRSI